MRNKSSEIFELFRKQRRENRDREKPSPAASDGSPGSYFFRRDTVIVFVMLAAVAIAVAFFAGVLIGRTKTGAEIAAKKPDQSRLLKPLDAGRGAGETSSNTRAAPIPAASIRNPVPAFPPAAKIFVIRVAAYPRSQVGKDFASKNAAILRERGFPADCRERGRYITIEVGKFADKNDSAAKHMLSKLKAFHLGGGRPFKDAFITSVSR